MELRSDVKHRLRSSHNWQSVLEELEKEVEKIEPKEARARALVQLGVTCEELFLRKDRAMVHYQAAFKLHPQETSSLERARRIYREMGNLEMVATLLGLELKVTQAPAQRADVQGRLGVTQLDLGQLDKALANLEAAQEVRTDDTALADAFVAASYDRDEWIDTAERLVAQSSKSDPATAARILFRVARIYRIEAPDAPQYEQTLREILAHDPSHEGANFALDGLLGRAKRLDEIAERYEQRLATLAEDPAARVALLRQMATTWAVRFGDQARAAHCHQRALESYYGGGGHTGNGSVGGFPGHLAAFTLLRDLEGARGEWANLLRLADLALGSHLPDDDVAILAGEAGLISWRQIHDIDRAKGYFATLQRVFPESDDLRAFIADVGEIAPRPSLARIDTPSESPQAMPVMAPVDSTPVAPLVVAAPAPVAAPPPVVEPVAAPAVQAQPIEPVEAVAEAAPPAVTPSTVTEVAAPPAEVAAPPAVVAEVLSEAVHKAMEAAHAVEAAGADKGIEAWRKLVVQNPGLKAPRAELARLYRHTEKWNALVELLKEQAEKLPGYSPEEKIAALFDLVEIYRDRLRLDVMVVNTFTAILQQQPHNERALDALATQYEHMKRWPDLIATLQKKAALIVEQGGGADAQIEIYSRIANLFQERFSNAAEAIKAYEKVLELDPHNGAAIAFLKTNYEKRRDWEKLIAVHQREIERIGDPQERGLQYIAVAKLASEKLKKPAVSIELWAKVLTVDPDHVEALVELEKLYEREKQWDQLAEVAERQANLLTDPTKKIAMLQKLGILFTEKVNDPARAIAAWRGLLAVEPENKRGQDALKKLYLQQKSWHDLEAFYAGQGKHDEYIRVLERQVETEDDETKVQLHTRIAELYRDQMQKPDRALRAYEKVLSLDAKNLGAAEALIPLYEGARDPRKLASVLEIQLEHTAERHLRVERMRRLAELSEQQLRDKAAAYGWCLKAFGENHDEAWTREDAERLARETGGFQALVAAYEAAAGKLLDGGDQAGALPLLLVVARVYEQDLGEPQRALETNKKILTLDENEPQAIAALERLYLHTEQFPELLSIYEKKLALESDDEAQKGIRYKIASLFEEEIKDPERAIQSYNAILDGVGDELPALRALDRIFAAHQRWRELGAIIPRELALVDATDESHVAATVELKFRLGTLREQHLHELKGAIECYRDILELDPAHGGARAALEKLLSDEEHKLEVAGILEPIYQKLGEWAHLISVHEIQLSRESDEAARTSLLLRIGELQAVRLGDGEKAFDAYSRCFREDPSCQTARLELERLAGHLEAWDHLVRLYEAALDQTPGPAAPPPIDAELARALLMRLGEAYDEKLDQPDKAVESYKRAQAIEPDDLVALEALERLYTKLEKWPDLLVVHRRRVELTDGKEEREALYFRMAYLQEEMLHNVDDAIATYNEVLNQDDGHLKALKALDRLYQVKGAWPELEGNLTRQLALTADRGETIELLVRLAALREHKLAEIPGAIETYRQVFDLDSDNEAATQALERLVQLPEHELTVATLLEPIYRARDQWTKLIGVNEIMVRHAFDPGRKIELLHQIAELHEVGSDAPNEAFGTLDRALREEPAHADTQAKLERLAGALERWGDLVAIYAAVVGGVTDPELQVHFLTRIAQIEEGRLGDNEKAARAYDKVLAVDPLNVPAADALCALYLRTEQYTQLVDVILRKVEIVGGADEKKELCFRAAQILEEVQDNPDRAIEVYRMVLQLDENDARAIDALERLYTRLARWESLKDVYAKKAELAPDLAGKKQMFFVLGQVYDEKLGDTGRAIETYQAVLDHDPEDLHAIQNLDRLYGQAARWYDLLQILEREVELSQSSNDTVLFKYRIGRLFETQINELPRAVESYREALSIDGMHEPTLAALDGLVHGEKEPVLAAGVLEPIFEGGGEWEKLIDVLEVTCRHAEDVHRKVELLHRIATHYERDLDRPRDAFTAYARALRENSTDEVSIGHLERLAQATGAWVDLVALYEEELGRITDPVQRVEMLLRAARVYQEELRDADKAIATHRRVLDIEPEQRTAILALDRLYEAVAAWPELADILRREVHLANTDEEIVELEFRLGQVYETRIQDLDKAIEVYREILNRDPAHAPTLSALEQLFAAGTKPGEIAAILEPLYRDGEQWEKLVRVHEVQLQRLTDPAERLGMLQRMAEICEQKLYDQVGALGWWSQALRESPLGELPGEEVERLAGATHAWEELTGLYAEILAPPQGTPPDADTQRRILLRLARVQEVELRDAASAEESHLRALQIDPKDSEALAALDRIYSASSMWPELADVLGRRIGVTTGSEDIVELYFRLGRVYEGALEEPDHAIASYNAILEVDSRNARALEELEKVYFKRQQWRALYGVYEKMIDIAADDAGMADCYARMAKIASDALGERDKSVDLWGRVIDLRGEDPTALYNLAGLYERAEQWRELVDVLERRIRISPPEEQVAMYSDLGRIWREKLGQKHEAQEAWLHVLEIDPANLAALRAASSIYQEMEAWEEHVDMIHRLIDVGPASDVSDEEMKELYAELGRVQGELLMRPEEAIAAWRKVYTYDTRDGRALAALETLFTQEARWEECIDVLEKKAAVQGDQAARIAVLVQAAAMWEEKVGDERRAAEVYERILGVDASNATASLQLEQIYRRAGSWEKLIDLLIQRTEFAGDKAQKIELFLGVAQVCESQLGDRENAFAAIQAAFREDFGSEQVARELERLATVTGKWSDLVTEYTQTVQGITDRGVAANLWVRIGRWYGEHLGHLEYAIASEKQALALDPDHKEALANLADFYRKTSKWQELASTLQHHASVENDPKKQVDLHLSIADLYEGTLTDSGEAVRSYRRAIAADPGCVDALNSLERLHRRGQQWPELIDVLGKKAQAVGENEDIIRLRHQIGALYDERMSDPARAIASYKEVLTLDAQDIEALKALERLYEKTLQMDAYLGVLDQQLDVARTDDERISIYTRQAVAWEQQFHKPEKAWEALEKILLINDRHEPTLRSLERIYRQERRWGELVDTQRRHINAVVEPAVRIELYAQMGDVYETELRDLDRAIESYTDILSFDPDHNGALAALSRLYERIADWDRAIDVMGRLVQLTDDPKTRVEMHHRIGRINEEQLKDPDSAESRYAEALSIDPGYTPAMNSLTALYTRRGDFLKAAQMMVKSEAFTQNQVDKVRLLYEAGRLYQEKLEDESRAGELFARVLDLDPEHVEAGEPLADLYFHESTAGTGFARWAELEPILDMLVRKAGKRAAPELNQLYYRLARTSDELGNAEKALRFYKSAYEIDSTYLPTLLGRAALLYKQEDWDGAFKIYQTILVHHRESQKDAEIVDIFYRLGVIKLKQGERKKALNMFEKALEIDPHHRPTLLAVIELQAGQSDWEAVVVARRALLPVADAEEQFKLLDEIGDLHREKQKNTQKAIAAYTEALALKPENHVLLHKVLELHHETQQWKPMIEVLLRITAIEKDPMRRGKYYYTAAVVNRDEMKALDDSVDFFNRALDSYFEKPDGITPANLQGYLKAFEAIDKICTGRKDWKQQERNYRKMIKRFPQDGFEQIKIALWHGLGEIYRSRLREYPSAMASFETAAKLDPGNVQRHEILAELYVLAGPDHAQKAAAEHMFLIAQGSKQGTYRVESLKALRKLYMDTGKFDKAWCMCAVLTFLQRADSEESAFYEQYKQKQQRPRNRVSDEVWGTRLFHPDEDRYIGAIFGAVWQSVALLKSGEHKQFSIKRKEKLDLANHPALFSKTFKYVAEVLNVMMPEVYLRPEQQIPGGMQVANCREKGVLIPSVVVGAELLQGRTDKELLFALGRFLTLLRPEHYLKLTLPTNTELRVAFLSALKLVQPNFPLPPQEAPIVEQYKAVMQQNLQPAWVEQLAMVVQRFLQSKGAVDLSRWSQAVELTAHRVGFVLCNDLTISARAIQLEPATVGGLQPKDKVKELLMYSISEEYFDVRAQLGMSIG